MRPISAVLAVCLVGLSITASPKRIHAANFGRQSLASEGSIDRDGVRLFYRVIGDRGPMLVILAGGPGANPVYVDPLVNGLKTRYQCVVLEQRGTGRSKLNIYNFQTINFESYLRDVEALRAHLKQSRLLLIGHSWGGMLALSYAGTYPDRVRGIVAIDSGPIAEEHAIAEEANVWRRLGTEEQGQLLEWRKRSSADPTRAFGEIQRLELSAYFYDPKKISSTTTWLTDGVNLEVMRLGYQAQFGSLDRYIRSRLHAIRTPVLLIHGRQDAVAEGGVSEAHRLIRTSKLVLLNECGHMPWAEQPDQLWHSLYSFLATI